MKLPLKKLLIVKRAVKAYHAPSQAPVKDDGEGVDFGDLFEDTRNEAPEQDVERREDFSVILKLLDSIDERDARVLRLRFASACPRVCVASLRIPRLRTRALPEFQILSPRFDETRSPLATMSKGFLIVGTRFTPSRREFKNTISRIRRFSG